MMDVEGGVWQEPAFGPSILTAEVETRLIQELPQNSVLYLPYPR